MSTTARGESILVAMLLDNHYGPDPRVEMEAHLLREAGCRVSIIAWDRRASAQNGGPFSQLCGEHGENILRIPVPAPPGGGIRTFVRMGKFAWTVLSHRRRLLRGATILMVHDIYLLPLARLLARLQSLPMIYDAHEEIVAAEARRYPHALLCGASRLETALARHALGVVVPGESRRSRWTACNIAPTVLPNLGYSVVRPSHEEPTTDIVCCGSLSSVRRLDLLLDLARQRPDIRIAIAGRGREEETVARAAEELPNLDFVGWTSESDSLLTSSRSVYYGLDPSHPYSAMACPNTLYQAIRLRRPLLFLSGGEPEAVAARFRIGIKCQPSSQSIAEAIDEVRSGRIEWQFDAAWAQLASREATAEFVNLFHRPSRDTARGPVQTSHARVTSVGD